MPGVGDNRTLQWAVFAIVGVVVLALAARVAVGSSDPSLAGALAVSAALLFLTIRVFDVGTLAVGRDGLRAELLAVKDKIDETDSLIGELFLLSMSSEMFQNLKKLSQPFGAYQMGPGLEREVRHLRDVGYVTVVGTIAEIPKEGDDLSKYVKLTPAGHQFVARRDRLAAGIK